MAKIACPNCGHHIFNVITEGGEAPDRRPTPPASSPPPKSKGADWVDCPRCNPDGQGCAYHDDCKGKRKKDFPECYKCKQEG